jgi:molybdopterin synthase sulfur carrier subunit
MTEPLTRLVYFAWVRERIGKPEEEVSLPAAVETVADLLLWLKARGEEYENALQYPEVIRVAINHEHVDHRERISGAREIALFPPMTGG